MVTVYVTQAGLEWKEDYGQEAAYLNVSGHSRRLFPAKNQPFIVVVESDSAQMELAVHGRGSEGHYISSKPGRDLNRWLKQSRAQAGDFVEFSPAPVEASAESICHMTLSRSDRV